jgi:hypothetical protein
MYTTLLLEYINFRIVDFIKKALGYSSELYSSKYTIKTLNTKHNTNNLNETQTKCNATFVQDIQHFSSMKIFGKRIKKYNEYLLDYKLFLYLQPCGVPRAN